MIYPLVMTNSLLLKMTIEIVDFPSYKWWWFSIAMLVYQRVVSVTDDFHDYPFLFAFIVVHYAPFLIIQLVNLWTFGWTKIWGICSYTMLFFFGVYKQMGDLTLKGHLIILRKGLQCKKPSETTLGVGIFNPTSPNKIVAEGFSIS